MGVEQGGVGGGVVHEQLVVRDIVTLQVARGAQSGSRGASRPALCDLIVRHGQVSEFRFSSDYVGYVAVEFVVRHVERVNAFRAFQRLAQIAAQPVIVQHQHSKVTAGTRK